MLCVVFVLSVFGARQDLKWSGDRQARAGRPCERAGSRGWGTDHGERRADVDRDVVLAFPITGLRDFAVDARSTGDLRTFFDAQSQRSSVSYDGKTTAS